MYFLQGVGVKLVGPETRTPNNLGIDLAATDAEVTLGQCRSFLTSKGGGISPTPVRSCFQARLGKSVSLVREIDMMLTGRGGLDLAGCN